MEIDMAEYWWIGYILMAIGWFLAGMYHKRSRRLKAKVFNQAVRLAILKTEKEAWLKARNNR